MSCTIYMVNCNFIIHVACLLALMTYKYNELQVSNAIKKLNCKINCKTFFFHNTSKPWLIFKALLILYWKTLFVNWLCAFRKVFTLALGPIILLFFTHYEIGEKAISMWRLCVGWNIVFWQDVGIFILVTLLC
jgi:hypothetical protein